ncbi:MAG: glycoside hydrolase family 43 protein, partial [Microbacterium sp.]
MSVHPILPGFHPDPSICRVGDRYYVANSSFEYFPGVPIFESRELLSWQPVGAALDRPSQLVVRGGMAGANGGVYAPTLRHHDGRFWIATTNIHEVARGHLIVHAEDPAGPWSEPVYVGGTIGVDPDLAWDEDGVCHLTWSDIVKGGISQVQINPLSGDLLSTPQEIWRGTGGAHAEGPHVFARDGWWYLIAAEGGTGPGHMVTIARSRAVNGPFEPARNNPILTHRSTALPVQATGHGDMVELADGTWAMVHLGIRQRGSFPRWHTNGRETFLVGVDWVDGWPVVDEERFDVSETTTSFEDSFPGPALHSRWISPGAIPAEFARPQQDGLLLSAGREREQRDACRLLATRVADLTWEAEVDSSDDIALVLRIDD